MEAALQGLAARETKQRLDAVDALQAAVRAGGPVGRDDVGTLVDAVLPALKDPNYKVCQGALAAVALAVANAPEAFKPHAPLLLSSVLERLGDGKAPVREAGRDVLLVFMDKVMTPTAVLERVAPGWAHKNWRVREEMLTATTAALRRFGANAVAAQKEPLKHALKLLGDSIASVREASLEFLEELYNQVGERLRDNLQQHGIRPAQLKDINQRFDRISAAASAEPSGAEPAGAAPAVKPPQATTPPPSVAPRSSAFAAPPTPGAAPANGQDGPAPVAAVTVRSEQELGREMEGLVATLTPKENWENRIAAMRRLEGLLVGGAASMPAFGVLLRQLRDPLASQLEDRRSAIVKQASHLVVELAAHLQRDFELFADHFVPVLFNVSVISVLIIAESGDSCMRGILRHCHAPRLLPRLASTLRTHRSNKLKSLCAEWVLLVVEEWADFELEHSLEVVEDCIHAAASDSAPGARAAARAAFRHYEYRWPEHARKLFQRLDTAAQRNVTSAGGAEPEAVAAAGSAKPSKRSALPSRQERMAQRKAWAAQRGAAPDAEVIVADDPPKRGGGLGRTTPRGAGAVRVEVHGGEAAVPETVAVVNLLPPKATGGASARRVPVAGNVPPSPSPSGRPDSAGPAVGGAKRVLKHDSGAARPATAGVLLSGALRTQPADDDATQHAEASPPSIAAVLSGAAAAADGSWAERVELFVELRDALRRGGPAAAVEAGAQVDRLAMLFVEHFADPHHRVAQALLEAFGELVPIVAHGLEAHLDRLLPLLFSRLVDAKELTRCLASSVLASLGDSLHADALLLGLLRSLESARGPKVRLGVLEFALHVISGGGGGGDAVQPEHTAATSPPLLRQWVHRVAPYVQDKSHNVRVAAVACLADVYMKVDAGVVLAYLAAATANEHATLRKALGPLVPTLDADLGAHMRATRSGTPHRAPPMVEMAGHAEVSTPAATTPRASPLDAARPTSASRAGTTPLTGQFHTFTADRPAPHVVRLLSMFASAPDQRVKTLEEIRRLARSGSASLWKEYVGQVLVVVLEGLADGSAETREAAAVALRDTARHQSVHLLDYVALIAPRLLASLRDPSKEVVLYAEDAMDLVFTKVPAAQCVDALRPLLSGLGDVSAPGASAPLRCLSKVVTRMPAPEVMALVPDLLPDLFHAFNSPSVDVRKAVVFCLVDLYMVSGDWLMPKLVSLSPSQLKLVTIYINRQLQRSADEQDVATAAPAKAPGSTRTPLAPRVPNA